MSAVNAPFGFRPAYGPNGLIRAQAIPDGILSTYGTAIFSGQPVTLNTNGTINAAAAAADILGVFAGCQYVPAGGGRPIFAPNWVAGTAYDPGTCVAYVYSDPEIVYEVQADGAIPATAVGDQADFSNTTAGSLFTGLSACTLSATLKGVGVQGQFRIVNRSLDPFNAWGDAFTWVQVQIARHQYVAVKVAI
jgi:hypothetical protein